MSTVSLYADRLVSRGPGEGGFTSRLASDDPWEDYEAAGTSQARVVCYNRHNTPNDMLPCIGGTLYTCSHRMKTEYSDLCDDFSELYFPNDVEYDCGGGWSTGMMGGESIAYSTESVGKYMFLDHLKLKAYPTETLYDRYGNGKITGILIRTVFSQTTPSSPEPLGVSAQFHLGETLIGNSKEIEVGPHYNQPPYADNNHYLCEWWSVGDFMTWTEIYTYPYTGGSGDVWGLTPEELTAEYWSQDTFGIKWWLSQGIQGLYGASWVGFQIDVFFEGVDSEAGRHRAIIVTPERMATINGPKRGVKIISVDRSAKTETPKRTAQLITPKRIATRDS